MVGAKWTWDEGELPEGRILHTRCTNDPCTDYYSLTPGTDPNEVEWNFVNLAGAPVGSYTFTFEVMDAYGNYDSAEITFEVVEDGNTSDPDTGGADDDDGSASGSNDEGTGGNDDDDGDDDGDEDDGTGTTPVTVGAEGGDTKEDCACTTDAPAVPRAAWMLGLGVLGLRRRR